MLNLEVWRQDSDGDLVKDLRILKSFFEIFKDDVQSWQGKV